MAVILVTFSGDPASTFIRVHVESAMNILLEDQRVRASKNELTIFDKVSLHTGIIIGTYSMGLFYPEGTRVLRHAVYGHGAELKLPSEYFSTSEYLNNQIERLGNGTHGPLEIRQSDDWRLSLCFNPYYLSITDTTVRLYHPSMKFTEASGTPTFTTVPIGKFRFKVWDNLVSALGSEPFYAYAEWNRQTAAL